jgi:uncharacterized membrane protein
VRNPRKRFVVKVRFFYAVVTLLTTGLACSREHSGAGTATTQPPTGFLDKVWTVVESPGGPSGDLYVFLSGGTLVIASKEGVPTTGKWSWDGSKLTMIESALPYEADIDSLTDATFRIRIHQMGKSYDVAFVPATPSMPDTTHAVEFNPTRARIIAMGHNPTWLFTVDNDRAMLRTRDGSLNYVDGEWVQDCAAVWDFEAHRKYDGGEETVSFEISTSICVDSTTGAESPLSATLSRGDTQLWGCAVAGKPSP